MEDIIQKHGNYLNNIWNHILQILLKVSVSEHEGGIKQGFKNLKLVISDYITRMSQANIIVIIDIIYNLAENEKNNLNNRLSSVGMFWNISDQISKNFKQGFTSMDEDSDYNSNNSMNAGNISNTNVDHTALWKCIFKKLHRLESCEQVEVRKHTLKILENIFMKHGASISPSLWIEVINDIIIDALRNNVRYVKMRHDMHSVDQSSKNSSEYSNQEWCLILMQIIIRWLKKYQINFEKDSKDKTHQDEIAKIWRITQNEIIKLLPLVSSEILAGVLGCIKEVIK